MTRARFEVGDKTKRPPAKSFFLPKVAHTLWLRLLQVGQRARAGSRFGLEAQLGGFRLKTKPVTGEVLSLKIGKPVEVLKTKTFL